MRIIQDAADCKPSAQHKQEHKCTYLTGKNFQIKVSDQLVMSMYSLGASGAMLRNLEAPRATIVQPAALFHQLCGSRCGFRLHRELVPLANAQRSST